MSAVGIGLTAVSAVTMPVLARYKRMNGERMRNPLVVADSAETKICAWMSISTLVGLGTHALVGWRWVDPAAGLVIAAAAVRGGREAWRGELHEH